MGVYEENIVPVKISRLAEYVSRRKKISLDDALVYIYANPMYRELYDEGARWSTTSPPSRPRATQSSPTAMTRAWTMSWRRFTQETSSEETESCTKRKSLASAQTNQYSNERSVPQSVRKENVPEPPAVKKLPRATVRQFRFIGTSFRVCDTITCPSTL